MSTPLLTAAGLCWHAGGRPILGPLDLAVESGSCLAVVGPNGAGKTTLLKLLAGLLAPSAGTLSFAGRPYTAIARRELARRVAYVPQIRPARVPFTVAELVLQGRFPYLGRWQLAPAAADHAAVDEALAVVGIEHLAGRRLDRLSGGERQAAYIAAALAQQAEVLILDEPTTHLDPGHQRDIAGLLLRLGEGAHRTVVTATHDLNFASLLADRVLALDGGRVLAAGPPGEILAPPLLERLFAARFDLVADGERPLTVLRIEP